MLSLGGQKSWAPSCPRVSPPRTLLRTTRQRGSKCKPPSLMEQQQDRASLSERLVCALSSTCTHSQSFPHLGYNGSHFTGERTEVERDKSLTRYCSLHLCYSDAHHPCLPGLPPLHRGCIAKGEDLGQSLASPRWGAGMALWSSSSTLEIPTPAPENLSGYRRFCSSESTQRKGRWLPREHCDASTVSPGPDCLYFFYFG